MNRSIIAALLLGGGLLIAACSKDQGSNQTQGNAATSQAQASPAAAPAGSTPSVKSDIDFAREALGRMVEGDVAVEETIDWENFVALGEDFGAEYRKMPEPQKAEHRRGFIEEFSREFKSSGSDFGKISNWREEAKDADKTVVAADNPPAGVTLLATVIRKDGRQKISGIDVRENVEK